MHRIEGANNTRDSQGRLLFTDGPPGTTLPAAWSNAVQEEIAHVIEQADISLKTASTDTRTQLYDAIVRLGAFGGWDAVVSSQAQFNDIIDRVAANQYKIKDQYRSVFLEYIDDGFQMSGTSSPLSGGDTWGYIETNNCSLFSADPVTYIDFGDTQGYIEVNTDDCALKNIGVQGTGLVASAINRSFLLNAYRVNFMGCRTSNRLSNANPFAGFEGSSTADHNYTSSYTGCKVEACDNSNTIAGFYLCKNLNNCSASDLETSASNVMGFYQCDNISNAIVDAIDSTAAGTAKGMYQCNSISNSLLRDIDSGATIAYGFDDCDEISSSKATDIQGVVQAFGFNNSNNISCSKADAIDSNNSFGFSSCKRISSCEANDIDAVNESDGFKSCDMISACFADNITSTSGNAYGFSSCNSVSACNANSITSASADARGFDSCKYISANYVGTITASSGTAEGYRSCSYVSAVDTVAAANTLNSLVDTADPTIITKNSTGNIWT